jgi:hypothetical protein
LGVTSLHIEEPLMKSLRRTWIACLVTAVLCLALADSAEAQSGRRRARFVAPPRPANTKVYSPRVPPAFGTFSPYDSWREGYPKYYGGFHSRYFTEMLYPTGDRPVRGTAW